MPAIFQYSVKAKIEEKVRKGLDKQGVEYNVTVKREYTSIKLDRYGAQDLMSVADEKDIDRSVLPDDHEVDLETAGRRRKSSWFVRIIGRKGTEASCQSVDDEDFERRRSSEGA